MVLDEVGTCMTAGRAPKATNKCGIGRAIAQAVRSPMKSHQGVQRVLLS